MVGHLGVRSEADDGIRALIFSTGLVHVGTWGGVRVGEWIDTSTKLEG